MYGCKDVWMYGCMDVWMNNVQISLHIIGRTIYIYVYIHICPAVAEKAPIEKSVNEFVNECVSRF